MFSNDLVVGWGSPQWDLIFQFGLSLALNSDRILTELKNAVTDVPKSSMKKILLEGVTFRRMSHSEDARPHLYKVNFLSGDHEHSSGESKICDCLRNG